MVRSDSQSTSRRRFILVLILNLLIAALFGVSGLASAQTSAGVASANSEYAVEFLIGDRTPETRKWGHVSVRVIGDGQDQIFDFGRYGRMWGRKDSAEGEPILRVWRSGQMGNYRAHHRKDGGTTRSYLFRSTKERNDRILGYFARMTNGARKAYEGSQMTAYNSNYRTFHAVEVNCVTVSIDAVMSGFPEYNLNESSYAKARTLQWYMVGEAQGHMYDSGAGRWKRIWWPPDLMALLDEQYVKRGLARVSIL